MQKVGKFAEMAETAIGAAGYVADGVGIAANLSEADVEDDQAMKKALVLSAAMTAAQLAAAPLHRH